LKNNLKEGNGSWKNGSKTARNKGF